MGSVGCNGWQGKDFSLPKVDKLTASDYDNNPKLMDIVRKSISNGNRSDLFSLCKFQTNLLLSMA